MVVWSYQSRVSIKQERHTMKNVYKRYGLSVIVIACIMMYALLCAAAVSRIVGGAVDATGFVPVNICDTFGFVEKNKIVVPVSTAFLPLSLSVVPSKNLWAATYAITAGGASAQVITGTLTPYAQVGTSTTVSSGTVENEMRVIADTNEDIHLINMADAAGPCGFSCFQYYPVSTSAVLGSPTNTALPALINLSIEGISQTGTHVYASTSFGAVGGGNAVLRFTKGGGILSTANGGENSVGSGNAPVLVDSVNNFIYSGHAASGSGIKQIARYTLSPLTFVDYVTPAGIGFTIGGFTLNTTANTLLLMSSEGVTTTSHSAPLTALTPFTNVVISAIAGNNATQNVVYDAVDNKVFMMTAIREVLRKNAATLATEDTFTDTNAVSPIPSAVSNGLQIDTTTKSLYYLRENVGTSSLELVQLGYCS